MELYQKLNHYACIATAILSFFLSALLSIYFHPPMYIMAGFALSVVAWIAAFSFVQKKVASLNKVPTIISFICILICLTTHEINIFKWCWISSALALFYMQNQMLKNYEENNLN